MALNEQIAHLYEELGRARASGVLGAGQATGAALGQIGQTISSLPQQIEQQKMQGLQRQDIQGQIAERNALAAERMSKQADLKALDEAYQQPGGRDAILAKLPGHLKPTVQAQFDSSDKAHADAQTAQQNADRLATDAFADTGAAIKAHGYDPTSAQLAISDLKAKYQNNPARLTQLQQAEAAIQQNPTPDAVKAIVDPLIQASPKRVELLQTADTHAETMRHDKAQEDIAQMTQGREQAAAAEAARHNAATEAIQKGNLEREQAAQGETARHNKATEAANNPLAALTGGAGAPASATHAEGAHGEDFLKTLPQNVASEVKAYAEGRRPFPAGFALKSPYFQSLIQMVGQYDPTFDAVNYNARSKTRNDFTSGKAAQTINALNTVTQHLDRLSDSADALNNSSIPAYNSIANLVSKATGNKQVTNFDTTKKAVVDELTRAWRGAGGSEGDIKSWSQVLDASESPEQLHGAIAEMGKLLEGKLSALQEQYGQGMGTTDTTGMRVVTPDARKVLDKLEARGGGKAGPAPSVSVGSIVTVKGKRVKVTAVHTDGTFDGDEVK